MARQYNSKPSTFQWQGGEYCDGCMHACKYASHPSIMKIKTSFKSTDVFEFSNTSLEEIKCYIKDLDTKKKASGNIPSSILIYVQNI